MPTRATPVSGWWPKSTGPRSAYVGAFLDLAARRGITVFWLLPPTSPAYQALREQGGRDARYTAFVRATQARYPNVVVIDGRHSGYGREVFIDATHLNRLGARRSSDVARDAHRAPPGRPLGQPAPVRGPRGRPLEDLGQSATALGESADHRLR